MDFYDELERAPPWRRVGWRAAIEQAYRFEAAIDVIAQCDGPVVDVGCGLAALAEYAAAHGVERRFIGIEPRASFAAQVTHEVICDRFEEIEIRGGCAVAIGTLDANTSLRVLLRFLSDTADTFIATVLDAEGLTARPLLWAEHAAAAVTRDELRQDEVGRFCKVAQLGPTDLLLTRNAPPPVDIAARFARTLDGPWGSRFDATERAWLAVELHLWDEASRWLGEAPDDDRAVLLRERLAAL